MAEIILQNSIKSQCYTHLTKNTTVDFVNLTLIGKVIGFFVINQHSPLTYKNKNGQAKYVNSESIPYIVVPNSPATYGSKGDISLVINTTNNKYAFAIVADTGGQVGEGSIKLAELLGVNSNPRKGGTDNGITYIIFPNSGNGYARNINEINSIGFNKTRKY